MGGNFQTASAQILIFFFFFFFFFFLVVVVVVWGGAFNVVVNGFLKSAIMLKIIGRRVKVTNIWTSRVRTTST